MEDSSVGQQDRFEEDATLNHEITRIRKSIGSRPSNSNLYSVNKVHAPEDFNTSPTKPKVVSDTSQRVDDAVQSTIDDILTENGGSQTSLNFGRDTDFPGNTALVPPEVKDWLVSTFTDDQENKTNKEKLGKLTGVLKKFSANVFGRCWLCCASCCCLNCCMEEYQVNDVAQRITVATSSASRQPINLDRKTIRRTRRNSLLLREQINNNNMLTKQTQPIVFNEHDCKLMVGYHRDRLRRNLTYPNNIKFRGQKPSRGSRFKSCLKNCLCFGNSSPVARPNIGDGSQGQRPSLRSLNRVDQARSSQSINNKKLPEKVKLFFKDQVNLWEFNIFKLPTEGHTPLKWMMLELLSKYQLIKRFDIPADVLDNFCHELEQGYQVFDNQYHNARHAADVLQTIHHLLIFPGLLHWLSDIEVFSLLISAAAHDLEHTGTTNAFHMKTRSDLAILYNDRSPLENHHVSCLFAYLSEPETNICINMSDVDYAKFRTLTIDMILGTDMQQHFKQLEKMKDVLKNKQEMKKQPALNLILHSADISNPAKPFNIHRKWTDSLLEEYFTQGDDEITMGLKPAYMHDRTDTDIPGSQIGFIEFIVNPCFNVLHDVFLELTKECVAQHDSKIAENADGNDLEKVVSWADSRKESLLSEEASFNVVPIDEMHTRVNQFHKKIGDILQSNSNIWKRQQEKVKEDEENVKRRQEIDDELNSKKEQEDELINSNSKT